MKNFIAKIGYTLRWGLGTPTYSFEEAFEQYYTVGLIVVIVGIICLAILPILIALYKKMESKEE